MHQTAVKNRYRNICMCTEKCISQLKCSILSFLKIFLVPYAFTGCKLRVGKFDVSASDMVIFCVNISSSSG